MFRITDIHTIAIQIEKNGEISYQQAAAHATNPKIKAAFEGMAEEERRHRHWFEGFQATHSSPPEHQELEAMGRSLLQSMITNQPFGLDQNKLNQAKTIAEIITQSKAFEEDTILFYQFLRSIIGYNTYHTFPEVDQLFSELLFLLFQHGKTDGCDDNKN